LVLTYKQGKLITAATRGDGKVGENVTANILTVHTVPLQLTEPIDLIAEGEIWLGTRMLAKINAEREQQGEPLFANPRNAAAGTIRQLDSSIVAERQLSVTAYDISSDNVPATQEEELIKLKKLGFFTDNHWKVCKNLGEIFAFYKSIFAERENLPFWIDGVVVKVNQKKYQNILGYTGKAPRWGIAFKFPAEQATTKITAVYIQVGRTGALTPVAEMNPVSLAGTTVTRATLHNFDEIHRLGVKVGDTVVVEKAGDVIPKVVRVLDKMRDGSEKDIPEPVVCPICGSKVDHRVIADKKQDQSAALFCVNKKCYAKKLENIIHFASKDAFDINGMGDKVVAQLLDAGLIRDPADIFVLTEGDLLGVERFGKKSAEKLITAILKAKHQTLSRFVYALGIRHVGEETARRLAERFERLDKIQNASLEELLSVEDVGPTVAEAIYNYFRDKESLVVVNGLLDHGVEIVKEKKISGGKLAGKKFVLTGTMESLSRGQAKEKIRQLGGEIAEAVSKETSYVVAGEEPGSKYEKAVQLNIPILTEDEFLKLIQV